MKQAHVMRLGVVICTFLAAVTGMAVGEEMDPFDYCKVRELREKLCLTNENLAAVGCNQAKAEAVLGAIKGWYETNKAEYLRRCKARDDAAAALKKAYRKMNVGPRDDSVSAQIPTLKANVTAALESSLEQVGWVEARRADDPPYLLRPLAEGFVEFLARGEADEDGSAGAVKDEEAAGRHGGGAAFDGLGEMLETAGAA